MFGSRFLDNGSTDFESVYSFGKDNLNASFFLLRNTLDIFAPWPRKWGSSGPLVVYLLHKWLISIFSKTSEDSNTQIFKSIIPEHIYIATGNDVIVIIYFRSAANRLHATVTTADFTDIKFSFLKIPDTTRASNFKILRTTALDSLKITQ